jgi:Type VI secretion system (T6SS), amidase effector protein 4
MSRPLPKFDLLSSNYPDEPKDIVKQNIGGHVNADWVTNTCAIRLSRALNYSGVAIPHKFHGLQVISGSDKKWYAYRMQELKKWVTFTFGAPGLVHTKGKDTPISREDFADHRGVMAFDIHFSDANGHIDLWDGSDFFESAYATSDYFARATRIVLWEAP